MRKVLLLAGEESGVIYARKIAARLGDTCPDVEIRGYADYGFEIGDLAVFGFWEVLRRIFFFLRVKRTMERAIDDWRPDVVCTVDYPGLNLKLAAYAKRKGIRAVHVVCPQVWAWHQDRIPRIEATLDRLCCFFPFEPALFRPGFAEFVGHPLADEMRREAAANPLRPPERRERLLAILPGSRLGEIRHHLPTMRNVVRTLRKEVAGLKVVIPAANERAERLLRSLAGGEPGVEIRRGGARELLRVADAAVVASGTATLEAALAACPTVLVYRVGWFLAMVARHVITGVRHVGLANVIAEKAGVDCPMPELLQERFTADNVLGCLRPYLTDSAARARAARQLEDTMSLLSSNGDSIANITQFLL